MESKARVMGHPVHLILVPFPLGLLTTSVIFDVVHIIAGGARWAEISFRMIAVGVVGGLLAAVFGLIDLGVRQARLLTNNPVKIEGLQRHGIEVVERVPLRISPNPSNVGYLRTKREKMGHLFPMTSTLEVALEGSA